MIFGSGEYTYEVDVTWPRKPVDWTWGWTPGMACDSQNRIFVNSRGPHPLVIFDTDGNMLDSWGEDLLQDPHGLFIDADDNVFCVERDQHCVFKFDRHGKLLMTIGTPGTPGAEDGLPFNRPTDLAVASNGDLFISDGYGNAHMHKYSADGTWLQTWGGPGDGPSQFNLCHNVRIDRRDRLWVCDRENNRIQIFDTDGQYLTEWGGLLRPNQTWFDPVDDIVYITELTQQISIYTLDHQLITTWGGGGETPGEAPGQFVGGPHGICQDKQGNLYVGEVFVDGRWHKYVRKS